MCFIKTSKLRKNIQLTYSLRVWLIHLFLQQDFWILFPLTSFSVFGMVLDNALLISLLLSNKMGVLWIIHDVTADYRLKTTGRAAVDLAVDGRPYRRSVYV